MEALKMFTDLSISALIKWEPQEKYYQNRNKDWICQALMRTVFLDIRVVRRTQETELQGM